MAIAGYGNEVATSWRDDTSEVVQAWFKELSKRDVSLSAAKACRYRKCQKVRRRPAGHTRVIAIRRKTPAPAALRHRRQPWGRS